ncbi:MAG TPA: hypothetical protein EYG46_09050 [Myxococcales bacterium]|nr:hypothetical protein [Myxococcales bacterium]
MSSEPTVGIVSENFFGTLNIELIYRRPWLDCQDARHAISEYIDGFCPPHERTNYAINGPIWISFVFC